MDFASRRTYYNRCKSFESLAPGDERNLNIDALGPQRVRGTNWTDRLANAIELADEPVFLLFTGLPGSGIVRLLQAALAHEDLPLSQPDFERMFNELKDAYRKVVPADSFAWLARVAADRYYTVLNDDHRQLADQMLLNNAILRYVNDNDWFDLHPAVAEIPGVQAARAALREPPALPSHPDAG